MLTFKLKLNKKTFNKNMAEAEKSPNFQSLKYYKETRWLSLN